MRILYTSTALFPSIGGVQVHVYQVARHLARQHEVRIVGHWDDNRRDWLRGSTVFAPRQSRRVVDGVMLHCMGMPFGRRLRMLPWMATYYLQMRRAADRLAGLMVPQLVAVTGEVDLVHTHRVGREFLSLASERLARHRGVPFVLTPHHHPRWNSSRYRNYLDLYRRADLVCVMTNAEAAAMEALGVSRSRLLLVGNAPYLAPHPDGMRFRHHYGLGDDPIVLFLGQKYEYKGIGLMLEAARQVWAQHPAARFIFIGPQTPYSKRMFARHDPRLLEIPPIGLEQKSDALAAADIVCVPSSQEALGIVYLEGWSLGKPVIGCRIPAVAEVIDHERDGLLVSPGSATELIAALRSLLSSPELGRKLGQNGRQKVTARYSWERCAQLLGDAYERLSEGIATDRPVS